MRTSPRRGPRCPSCGSTDTLRIVYGYPAGEAIEAAERGEIFLGGCCITGHDPTRWCRACEHSFTPPRTPRRPRTPEPPRFPRE